MIKYIIILLYWQETYYLNFITYLHDTDLCLIVPDEMCTRGFSNPLDQNNYTQSQLVPLLGRYQQSYSYEQWIFPNMKFTCPGTVTKWVFKGVGGQEATCRVELATWRLAWDVRTFTSFYAQTSTTNGNTARTVVEGSIFTYELATPVQVQPGDIIGVEISSMCMMVEIYSNVLTLNVSGNSSTSTMSYWRLGGGTQFYLESSGSTIYDEQGYQPLIQATVGKLIKQNII